MIEMENDNNCDCCGIVMVSTDLIWITAEDFEPKENIMRDIWRIDSND